MPTSESLCSRAVGDGPKVGMAYDVGGRNDRGANDAAFAGLSEAVDELHATCLEGEAAGGEQESARVDRLRHFADNGATVIVAIGTRYVRAVDTVSQSYPQIQFALIDAVVRKRKFSDNVAVLTFNPEQIGYLAGVAAALTSRSGTVGFVGAPPADVLESAVPYQAGFQAGAEAAKPTVKVVATQLERDTPARGKPDGPKKVATAEFEDEGADVVFGSPGVSQRALFNAARVAGDNTWVVGVGSDQYQAATDDQKPHILTSVVKRYDTVTYDFLESAADAKPLTGRHDYGADDDAIDFVTSGKFLSRKNVARLRGFQHRIESGNIEVPAKLA
ncbi:MAG TPA: BMP family ABC transporter substrate-binding protein [Aeromicrobium sp.]|nr:BMP family ABC transporter substrate-binding protein [Aeromicrobium sp.]